MNVLKAIETILLVQVAIVLLFAGTTREVKRDKVVFAFIWLAIAVQIMAAFLIWR